MGESTPNAALVQLQSHVETLKTRYKDIEDLFEGFPVSPLRATDFRKFLEDHTCLVAMQYITLGKFALEGTEVAAMDSKADKLRAEGFAVSGSASPVELDPVLAQSPAALAAIASGFSLDQDPEDDGDRVAARPSTKA